MFEPLSELGERPIQFGCPVRRVGLRSPKRPTAVSTIRRRLARPFAVNGRPWKESASVDTCESGMTPTN